MATKAEVVQALAEGKGCLGKAYADEPVFILRAKDMIASDIVYVWARMTQRLGGANSLQKVIAADMVVEEIRQWQNRNQNLVKVAD